MGIVVSTNGGTSWTPVRVCTLAGSESTIAAVAPDSANVLYVGGYDSSWKGILYRSTNGGAAWTDITGTIDDVPTAIAVDPQDSDIVYAATYSKLFRSTNGGAAWTQRTIAGYSYGFAAVVVNKSNPNEVFVGFGKGVLTSKDRGLTWTDISEGLDISTVKQLYFNPTTRTLYAATEGGGVWKKTL
jgi:photosystem II stability/assembly factor-like uncharacterized protein